MPAEVLMSKPVFLALALASLALAACGGGGSYPACQLHKTVFSGTLEGEPFEKTFTNQSTLLSQLDNPPTLKIDFVEGGNLQLTWSGVIANEQQTDVTGTFTIAGESARTVGSGSTLEILGEGYQLDLKFGTDEIFGCAD
jgi:hypothetical protein